MNTRTSSLHLDVPRARAFAYLSDVRNLPRWATEFCKGLETVNGHHWVTSPAGRVLFKIRADEKTGVIDYLAGPSADKLAAWPARVFELCPETCLFLFTSIQDPATSDGEFEAQCAGLKRELENVRRDLESS